MDGDKRLTESDLPKLLDLVACVEQWEDLGLELGLTKSEINVIAKDKNNDPGNCKSEILYKWLMNSTNPTLNSLKEAIRTIGVRADINNRKGNKAETKEEEIQAVASVKHLAKLLHNWEIENQTIVTDQKKLLEDVKNKEEEFQIVEKWNEEKSKWCQGDTATQRTNIVEALRKGKDYTDSSFVKTFLESKHSDVDISKVKDEVVEGLLRLALMEIDTDQLDTIGDHYSEISKHLRKLKILQIKITNSTKLLEERVMMYKKVREDLEKIGVRTDRLIEYIEALEVTARECLSAKSGFDEKYLKEKQVWCQWKEDLDIHLKTFDENIKQMALKESEFENALVVFVMATGTAVGIVSGAMTGGTIGTGITPVIGTVLGAVAGGVLGAAAGLMIGSYNKRQAHECIDHLVQNYREKLHKGRITRDNINKLLTT